VSKRISLPTIPEPYANVTALHATCMALKEAVELLSGQRGQPEDVAVTWKDLMDQNLVKKDQVPRHVGSNRP